MKQVSARACETVYDVDGVKIRLWIIVGGTPAIDFENYGFSKRFPDVEKWSDKNWDKNICRYKHQIYHEPKELQGPTFEVLPNGEQDILDFIKENLPKMELSLRRSMELIDILKGKNAKVKESGHGYNLVSKGKRDIEEHTVARVEWLIRDLFVSSLTIISIVYAGFVNEKINLFSQWWNDLKNIINPIDNSVKYWCDISEEKYQEIKAHVEKFNPKKD